MGRHFHEEIEQLRSKLFEMGDLVFIAIEKAIHALMTRDPLLAHEVIQEESKINRIEIQVDEEGHGLSAMGQPMAGDLRNITGMLKINTDLERLGDHAVNIAERTFLVLEEPRLESIIHLPEMAELTLQMLKDALSCLKNENVELAQKVLRRDDEVDAYNDRLFFQLEELIEKDPTLTRLGMNMAMISHNLERIADLANNIAEDVIYMKHGSEVRHRSNI